MSTPNFGNGATQCGDLWNTASEETSPAIAGTVCMALAPLPTTPTFFPVRSTSAGHSAVWKAGPSKVDSPGSSGTIRRVEESDATDHHVA